MSFDYVIGSVIVIGFLGSAFLGFFLWNLLHLYLGRCFDPQLFRRPYFSERELHLCNSWPMSLQKTTIYMLLLVYPSGESTRRRFSQFQGSRAVHGSIYYLVWATLALFLISTASLVIAGVYVSWTAFVS